MKTSKAKLFKHSTTFYRKVKNGLKIGNKTLQTKIGTDILKLIKTNNSDQQWCGANGSSNIRENLNTQIQRGNNENGNSVLNSEFCSEFGEQNGLEGEAEIIVEEEYSPSESSEFLNTERNVKICQNLRKWALEDRISHLSLNRLLNILKDYGIKVPSDSRTLLKTPTTINIVPLGTGHYWYFGIERNLRLAFGESIESNTLQLIFNIDGLPPFKSSNVEFWPILFRVSEMKEMKPMVAALYCGKGKPPLEPYLSCLITELSKLLTNGIIIRNKVLKIRVKYFVCDTPARSYIKGTKGFNSTHGCQKCTVEGEYDLKGRHMSFPEINCEKRTDLSFRNQIDSDHHKERSPLTELNIDMVEDIIVADSLHLIDLGVVRKCLYGWIYGSFNFRTKLSGKQIDSLSQRLLYVNYTKPREIHRSIRSLDVLRLWKGTEYRTFILYVGPVILKDFLAKDTYDHFVSLFCIVRILSSPNLNKIYLADILVKDYIAGFIKLYGRDSISSNVHNLCHMIDDVRKFGPLPDISSYPFENLLQYLKSLLRSGYNPLQQMAKRVVELSYIEQCFHSSLKTIYPENEIKSQLHCRPFCSKVFQKICFENKFVLASNGKDKWFMNQSNEIIEMVNATYFQETLHVYGIPIKDKQDFFTLPIKSSYLDVYQSSGARASPKLISVSEVKCKLFCIKYHDELVFIPLLHTN